MSEDTAASTMHIGAVAERTGLSLRTLRHWEEVGLVEPSARSDGGFRLYTERDVDRILLVRRMKPLGFSLAEMGELLDVADRIAGGSGSDPAARARLDELLATAQQRRDELARKLDMADEFIDVLRGLT